MAQYRKKENHLVIVEAEQLTSDNVDKLANWAQAQIIEESDAISHAKVESLNVWDKTGKHKFVRCSQGMYLVKYGDYFYPFGRFAFEAQYELVG